MNIDNTKADVIVYACLALTDDNINTAKKIIEKGFPFSHYVDDKIKLSETEQLKIFLRDGFIDRYTGKKVFLPVVTNILSQAIPEVFPNHPNWKYTETHQAHALFYATVDKIVPSYSSSNKSNLVTTSYINKIAKANANLEDLGWKLFSLEEIEEEMWDGMMEWFINYVEKHQAFLNDNIIANWYKAVRNVKS